MRSAKLPRHRAEGDSRPAREAILRGPLIGVSMPQPSRRLLDATVFVTFVAAIAGPASGQEEGQWTRPGKDFAATRFSRLTELTPATVGRLRPVWSFSTGVLGGHEG